MLELNDHVRKKGTAQPIGILESFSKDMAHVNWGTADKNKYEEDVPIKDLEPLPYHVTPPEEVEARQAREKGGRIVEE